MREFIVENLTNTEALSVTVILMNNILNDDEVLNKYKDMSREEVLDLFGEEKSLIQEELKNGTFSYDKLKEVLILKYWYLLSRRDIAKILNVSEKTITNWKNKAFKLIKNYKERRLECDIRGP